MSSEGIHARAQAADAVTVDGCVAGPEGQLDWMTFEMDAGLLDFINRLTDTSGTILLGRKMTDGFIKHWEQVVTQNDSPEYDFAQKMVGMPKIVFRRTLKHVEGKNVRVENGDLAGAVKQLKGLAGKNIVVYGGATLIRRILDHLGLSPPEKPPSHVPEVLRVAVDDEGREIGANPALHLTRDL